MCAALANTYESQRFDFTLLCFAEVNAALSVMLLFPKFTKFTLVYVYQCCQPAAFAVCQSAFAPILLFPTLLCINETDAIAEDSAEAMQSFPILLAAFITVTPPQSYISLLLLFVLVPILSEHCGSWRRGYFIILNQSARKGPNYKHF